MGAIDDARERRDWLQRNSRAGTPEERVLDALIAECERLVEERDWLRDRSQRDHDCTVPRDYGVSSDALCRFAVGGPDPRGTGDLPWDGGDLAACERAYQGAPAHLKPRMLPVLTAFRAHVNAELGAW